MRAGWRCLAILVTVVPVAAQPQSTARDSTPFTSVATARTLGDTLEALERASWVAWQRRDSAFFSRFLAADHVEVGVGGPVPRRAVLAGVASPACVVAGWHVDRFTTTRLDDRTAILTYHAEQDTRCNGVAVPSPAWATSLYVWRDGRWQNALYQQTPIPRPKS